MAWFVDHYLAGYQGHIGDPRVSPLLAPDAVLATSPPTLVITAGEDPLCDEGDAYAQRLQAAGVPTSLVRFEGMIHGFVSLAGFLDDGRRALALIGQTVADALDG
jgi:acetyl esterase